MRKRILKIKVNKEISIDIVNSIINEFLKERHLLDESKQSDLYVKYIANRGNVGNDSLEHASYYNNDVLLTYNGVLIPGVIRVSNHPVNIDIWKKHEYSFGVSIVVTDKDVSSNKSEDNDICIYEYILDGTEPYIIDDFAEELRKVFYEKSKYFEMNQEIDGIKPNKIGNKSTDNLYKNIMTKVSKSVKEALDNEFNLN